MDDDLQIVQVQRDLEVDDETVQGYMDTVWEALYAYREDLIPEGDESYDYEWSNLTYAMAKIQEALDCAG